MKFATLPRFQRRKLQTSTSQSTKSLRLPRETHRFRPSSNPPRLASGEKHFGYKCSKGLGPYKDPYQQNFWVYTRPARPYFTLWIYCNDSFYDQESFNWSKMKQSLQSVLGGEEFQTGAVICEGHRILDFPEYDSLATTTSILSSNASTLQIRGICPSSIRRHKLHMSNKLDFIESMNSVGIFPSDLPTVAWVCPYPLAQVVSAQNC